ncbi:hypothetical protein AB670_00076 [Chryseobacterium sp. MOF25P]|uniref:DUF4760 domain-containing protein n=1 Tax=unclassified Chryseobacterium TaxID=2593645 RepID=UPI0008052D0F|nr:MULTISPECIES: DUF4760 domain-containing protein [unclassified Chryseobacterium]OBW43546.1 hypothetical protein AB670_00076 [Chryseobacterium sp. MOF25P]OBW46680.1 hypothetical protein AB671_01175 [Chryseobacterium sp. BGARF1]
MKGLFNKKYSIKLVWILLIGLAVIFCFVFLGFHFIANWSFASSLDYTAKITLAMLAFLTLIYHIHNLENQIRTQEESNKQNLSKYTYDICADFRRPTMMEINEHLRCLIRDQNDNLQSQNISKFSLFIDDPKNIKQRQALAITLNYFESISAMVLVGDLDDEIVKRLFGKLFGRYYVKLQHYINFRQEEAPKSWINFEKLAKKWIDDEKS